MKVTLPNLETVAKILSSTEYAGFRERIRNIAKRLEALNEYSAEQALMVATDIVLNSNLKSTLTSSSISIAPTEGELT